MRRTMRSASVWLFLLAGTGFLLVSGGESDAQTSADTGAATSAVDAELRARIVAEKATPAPRASDAEFLRRVSLDLTGRLPSPERTVAFLDSKDPQKRVRLVDELLASPAFANQIARVWTKRILAIGTPGPNDDGNAFHPWLAGQIREGKGWDAIVRSILTINGTKQPQNFFFDANTDDGKFSPALMTGVTTQLFLGVQVQCAECHNHPFTELKQTDFWGLAAFYGRTTRTGPGKKGNGPSEIQDGVVKAAGKAAKAAKKGKKGDEPVVGAKDNAGVPAIVIPNSGGNKGSGKVVPAKFLFGDLPAPLRQANSEALRPYLAEWVTSPKNPYFAKNAANWAWSYLMGRGFVHPIDDLSEDSEPSHPKALDALAATFVASGHDLRHLFRAICLTEAYGRSSTPVAGGKDEPEWFTRMPVRTVGPEVFHDMLVGALAVPSLNARPGFANPLQKDGKKVKGPVAAPKVSAQEQFTRTFTTERSPDQQTEFTHGIPQMLRLLNADELKSDSPRADAAVKAGATTEAAIEHLYLATLTRRPDASETAILVDYVRRRPTVRDGLAGALWILINSSEFQLNH